MNKPKILDLKSVINHTMIIILTKLCKCARDLQRSWRLLMRLKVLFKRQYMPEQQEMEREGIYQ